MTDAPRIILVGPPRSGKSTYARKLREEGIPTFCTDPKCLVKDVEEGVTYLPDNFADKGMWSHASWYIGREWFSRPGPWCIEGVATVRALRKILTEGDPKSLEGIRIVRFKNQYSDAVTKSGQVSMGKAIETIWNEIAHRLPNVEAA